MRIRLSKEILRGRRACREGIGNFTTAYPDGLDMDWSREMQIHLLKTCPVARRYLFGWAYPEGVIPVFGMYGANLKGANLRSADLRSADLRSANLRSADLRSADLRSADLEGANLPEGYQQNERR